MLRILLFSSLVSLAYSFTIPKPSNWKVVYSKSGVTIEDIVAGCEDVKNGTNKEYVFFKIKNKTDKMITIRYSLALDYNGKCYTCDNLDEYTYTFTLEPNEELIGDCENKEGLAVFSKMLDGASNSKLTNYEIKNVVINK